MDKDTLRVINATPRVSVEQGVHISPEEYTIKLVVLAAILHQLHDEDSYIWECDHMDLYRYLWICVDIHMEFGYLFYFLTGDIHIWVFRYPYQDI